MKKQNHRNQHGDIIEKIEQIIEDVEPGTTVSISDIARRINMAKMDHETQAATILLLKKYGFRYTL